MAYTSRYQDIFRYYKLCKSDRLVMFYITSRYTLHCLVYLIKEIYHDITSIRHKIWLYQLILSNSMFMHQYICLSRLLYACISVQEIICCYSLCFKLFNVLAATSMHYYAITHMNKDSWVHKHLYQEFIYLQQNSYIYAWLCVHSFLCSINKDILFITYTNA